MKERLIVRMDPGWLQERQHRLEATVKDLLWFAEMDLALDELRAQKAAAALIQRLDRPAWSRWRTNIARVTPSNRKTGRPDVSPKLLEGVQAELRRGLALLFPVKGNPRQWDMPATQAQLSLRHQYGRLKTFFIGEWPNTIWVTIAGLLEDFSDRIRRCPDPDCGVLFLRVRKQEFCCLKHARRVYMRRYRAG